MSATRREVTGLIRSRTAPLGGSLLAILAALLVGGLFLAATGHDPIPVYRTIFGRGAGSTFGVTESLTKAAPLLFVAAGLLIALRTGVWNIGIEGQLLVGALCVGYVTPKLVGDVPRPALWVIGALLGFAGGLAWSTVPGFLRVRYGLNEIITTIMMNYVAISLTAYLVKGPLKDPAVVAPQTAVIPPADRLPNLPFTDVHIGVALGALAVLTVAALFLATSLGFKLQVTGQGRRAALHAGYPVGRLMLFAMLLSGGCAGLAGANDVLATKGLFQANWYPAYGLTGFALVYLARLRPLWVLPVACFFGVLELGGDLLRSENVPNYFIGLLEGLMLIFLAIAVRLERVGFIGVVGWISHWRNRLVLARQVPDSPRGGP